MMLAVLMLALVSAPQLPQPKAEPTIQNPDWLDKPNGDDLADVYPEKAQIEGLGGSARMECGVTVSGILVNCHVLEESPPGYGFGEAVLKLAPKFKMTPRMRDGVAVASGTVVIPVRFLQPSAPEIGDGATFVRQLQWVSRPHRVGYRGRLPEGRLASRDRGPSWPRLPNRRRRHADGLQSRR